MEDFAAATQPNAGCWSLSLPGPYMRIINMPELAPLGQAERRLCRPGLSSTDSGVRKGDV